MTETIGELYHIKDETIIDPTTRIYLTKGHSKSSISTNNTYR